MVATPSTAWRPNTVGLCQKLGELVQRQRHHLQRRHAPQVSQVKAQVAQLLDADDAGVVKKLQIAQDTWFKSTSSNWSTEDGGIDAHTLM